MSKSSARKTLKNLFSKSEANLAAAPEKDAGKSEGEKKKFKFPKLKIKSKSSGTEKPPVLDSRQLQSIIVSNTSVEDGEARADSGVPKDRSAIYATAPRSKSSAKELSYSEMDLRKPKRFATFSLGLRKRKKKLDDNISKSTFGLDSPGFGNKSLGVSQTELDQADIKKRLTMSQPVLDESDSFDIPSPPPVATNRFEASFPLLDELRSELSKSGQLEAKELVPDGKDHDEVPDEPQRAPIASIPELQLDYQDSSLNKENVPAHDNAPKIDVNSTEVTVHIETTPDLEVQTQPVAPAGQPPVVSHAADQKDDVTFSSSTNGSPCDIPEQLDTNTEASPAELSHHQPDEPDAADWPYGKPSLASDDSRNDASVTESAPVHQADVPSLTTDSASVPEINSAPEKFIPEAPESVSAPSTVDSEEKAPPVHSDKVYSELYESLLPQNFTSEVVSSFSYPSPKLYLDTKRFSSTAEHVTVTTLDERHSERLPERHSAYSHLSSPREFYSASRRVNDTVSRYSPDNRISTTESSRYSSSQTSFTDRDTDFRHRYPNSSLYSSSQPSGDRDTLYSGPTQSVSDVKSDSFSIIRDTARSAPEVQISTPPIHDYVSSRGTHAQVTDTTRKVILVKELVTDETSTNVGGPSPVPDEMSTAKSLELNIDTAAPPGEIDAADGLRSPSYLSVGSDDGSAMEIYYSAEEDNVDGRDDDVYSAGEREETYVGEGMRKVGALRNQYPEEGGVAEMLVNMRDMGKFRGIIVQRTRLEEKEDYRSRSETPPQLSDHAGLQETDVSESLVGDYAKSGEKEEPIVEFPQVKEEEQERRKVELPATPVEQVNTPMECKIAPPCSELHGQQEASEQNWAKEVETEDHPNRKQPPASQETEYLAYRDTWRSESVHAAVCRAGEENIITPKSREAEEQVLFTVEADKTGEVSQESQLADTDSSAAVQVVTGPLTHSSELQSDATETEHNRPVQSSEWVDTITQSTDRIGAARQQVTVEPSAARTHHPGNEAADGLSESGELRASARDDTTEGSLTPLRSHTAASEGLASENQPARADWEAGGKMYPGYSRVSTNVYVRSSSSPRLVAHDSLPKLSFGETREDTADVSKTSPAETESNEGIPDYRWRNRFEGVSQYKPPPEDSSRGYRLSDTYLSTSSALPESSATHKYLANTLSSSSSPASEEHIITSGRLTDSSSVYVSREGEPAVERGGGWRSSLLGREEPDAPAGEQQGEGESEKTESLWDTQQLPVSDSVQSVGNGSGDTFKEEDGDSSRFTGVFQATRVELVSDPPALPSTPPASPEADSPNQFDMESLVDTLKNMGPSMRPRTTGIRAPAPVLISSLPPIVEDAQSPATSDVPDSVNGLLKKEAGGNSTAEPQNGFYTLPPDLGLRGTARDTRSPLELMKQTQQDQPPFGTRSPISPLKANSINGSGMRKLLDTSPEDSPSLNGNGASPAGNSRLDNSVIFGGQNLENRQVHRSIFRTSSLPETGLLSDRAGAKEPEAAPGADPLGGRYERFSFLLNSSSSSLSGAEDTKSRMSRSPQASISSPPSNSPTRLLSPTGSIDLHRPFAISESPLSLPMGLGMGLGTGRVSAPVLQRSLSAEGNAGVQQTSLFNSAPAVPQFQSKEPEPERNLMLKYRAFPDAYLTKTKEHGKLNPRPGKIFIFDRPGMCGQRIELGGDVIDATSWELQETISIRVVRGGWVLYEKPNFKGEKIALDEGDIELTYPFTPPEEALQNGHTENKGHDGEAKGETSDGQTESQPARKFIIGSIRRAVRDYSVPEISLFPEENAEGKKVVFRDSSEDARIFGFPIKANSVIVNAGLWLVYAHPFFQGVPRVLEVGGYTSPEAWGVDKPYVGSLHPLKIGEPRVENTTEPKIVIYDKPYFAGKSRTITTSMRDFMTRKDRQQTAFMYSVGSMKVLGGIWVGYEKEGYRGNQYLLEEGEYQNWRVWGGCDSELRSIRVIRADLTDPVMVMFELLEEDEDGMQEEKTFEVTEAIPDVELFDYKTSTRSIHVLSGAWIVYSHVDFSGHQFILEKGFYNNCADWGSQDNRICSVQPILLAQDRSSRTTNEVILYPQPDFQGECEVIDRNQEALSEKLLTKSCRVSGGSWVLYGDKQYSGTLTVLSEGDYPNLASMGCPSDFTVRSLKVVPMTFSVPSISLFGHECLEGREITTESEIISMAEEGFNNEVLSLRVNSGCWVICEHSNYRGRQFLLEPIEITNWLKFSSLETVGSLYPVRQKRHLFRIRNKERGHFMSIQGGVEEMKSGRVVVAQEAEPMSDVWFYQDGLIKNKLSPNMCLQVMGSVEPGAKVVLWTETRQPVQTWTAKMSGLITSLSFPGMVLDVKGGKTYDKDHVVILPENDERPSQQWEIELL